MIKLTNTSFFSFTNLHKLARIAVLSLGALLSTTAQAQPINGKAKSFTVESNSGDDVSLSDFRGQVVMLNFWASWCGPCRQEMPQLNKLYKRYNRSGFTVLGINVDKDKKLADKALKKTRVTYPILYDIESDVAAAYKIDTMPSTIFIDCDGKLNYRHRGYKAGEEKKYKSKIKELLRSCTN